MSRKKKLFYNTITSLFNQFIVILCGFIIPKFIMKYYGSATNGLITSIGQFLGIISLCECGVGAVVQSTLYKPLAEDDYDKISKIYKSSNLFFKKIAVILVVYTIVLVVIFPYLINAEFSCLTTGMLIIAVSINYFGQYYFGMTNKVLLNADQLSFIQYTVNSITAILNMIISVALMILGFKVAVMKIVSSLIFLIQPLFLQIYVRHKYNINYEIVLTEEPIPQKWNGMAQHVATVVLTNTDTVVLTIFSTLENVSIYGVYHMVVLGIKQIIMSLTAGVQSLLGNMYAKKEQTLIEVFSRIEWIIHYMVTLLFGITLILIVPFVRVYTRDITDANYVVPVFGALITIAQACYCYRLPYSLMVMAVGHYKQTQLSAIIEASLNVIISILLVSKYGLIGVCVGTIISMGYRTIYYVIYLKNNILHRELKYFVKHIIVDFASIFLMYVSTMNIRLHDINFLSWIILAVCISAICLVESLIINYVFYHKEVIQLLKFIKNKNK